MRSERENREADKMKYASARGRAEKKQQQASFSATYLKLPQGIKLFKPKVGLMLLDMIPYKVGEGNSCADAGLLHYERTYHLHPRVSSDGNPYLCPRLNSKSPCPICEHRQRLLKESDPDNEQMIKDMAPKERQLFHVLNLKEPDKGVQLWDMSYHLFGKLLDARIRNSDEDEGWDQFAALKGGMTLKVAFKENSFGGRTFTEAETIDFKARAEDYGKDILEQTHCLDDLLIEVEYDQLKEVFLEAGPSKKDEDDDEDEKPVKKKKPAVEDDEEEDEDDEEEPAPKKKKAAAVDEDEEKDDEDEEEPAPKKKKKPAEDDEDDDFDDFEDEKPKKKKAAVAEEDEEEEDEDEEPAPKKKKPVDDDEEEEEDEESASKKKYIRPSRAKSKTDDEEEEEEEEDDEDPPRIKSGTPPDDEEEDEDEEPAPKRKR